MAIRRSPYELYLSTCSSRENHRKAKEKRGLDDEVDPHARDGGHRSEDTSAAVCQSVIRVDARIVGLQGRTLFASSLPHTILGAKVDNVLERL